MSLDHSSSSDRETERIVRSWLTEGTTRLPDRVLDAVLDELPSTPQRRAWWPAWRMRRMNTPARIAIAASAIGVVAVIGIVLLPRFGGVGGPTTPPGPTPSPMTLIWTESSLSQDWPAPIRPEPGGAPIVVPFGNGDRSTYVDQLGDMGPAGLPWLDIQEVGTGGLEPGPGGVVSVYLAADIAQPVADPSERWIAYGLVLDTNGDGIPDARIGIDNMPATDEPGHRAWRTDLATGQTMSAAGGPYGYVGGRYLDTFFPGESAANRARFGLGLSPSEPRFRFYAWASMIEGGHVVATDYAPDAGWLEHPGTIP